MSRKAVLRKQRKVRVARTDRLKANTAFSRDNAVFMAAASRGEIWSGSERDPTRAAAPPSMRECKQETMSAPSEAVTLQVSSQEWLKVSQHDVMTAQYRSLGHVILNRQEHGLDVAGLTVNRILSSLGFQQRSGTRSYPCTCMAHSLIYVCTGPVEVLKHSVSSRYCEGVFLQHPDSSGNVYNVSSQMWKCAARCSLAGFLPATRSW